MPIKIIFSLLLVFFCLLGRSQRELDSLRTVIASSSDTNKVNAMLLLAKKSSNLDSVKVRQLNNDAINLSIKLNYKKGITYGYCQKALQILSVQNDSAAFLCLNELLSHIDTIKPNIYFSKYLLAAATICSNNGQFDKAINCYLRSLKISDAINNKQGSAAANHGLSFANLRMNNYDKSEYYGVKALALYEQLKDEAGVARMNASLGAVYLSKSMNTKKESDYNKAFKYLTASAEAAMKIGALQDEATCYTNLGVLFGFRQNNNLALLYCRKALQIKMQLGNKYGIASTMSTMSEIFEQQKNKDSLEKYAYAILKLAREINAPLFIETSYKNISKLFELKKEPEKALEYYKIYKTFSDSIINAEKLKALADVEEKYESEKKDKEIVLLGELQQAKDKELAKQMLINYIIAGSLGIVLILSLFVFKQYTQKKKAHNLLEHQNEIIKEKNQSITDSINYAKVIQSAVLLGEDELSSIFPDAFLVFKPKDIVSGDFYWFTEKNGKKIIAAVDCTGHGVPGAFMSMIGISFLNEIINEKGITEPSLILGELRDRVKNALKQKGQTGEAKDGMDMAILSFNENFSNVEFAGANNSLWRIPSGANDIIETAPDKRPIGYFMGKGLPFTNHKIDLQKGDSLYIFTDGYADQFGGLKGKKFMYKQLKDVILQNTNKSLKEQKNIFLDTIIKWQGGMEQTDDICLIGIKV